MGRGAGPAVPAGPLLVRRAGRSRCRPEGDAAGRRRGRRGAGRARAVGWQRRRTAHPARPCAAGTAARAGSPGERSRRAVRGGRDRRRRRPGHASLASGRRAVPVDRRPRSALARPCGALPGTRARAAGAIHLRVARHRLRHARPRRLPPPQRPLTRRRVRGDRPEADGRRAGVRRRVVPVEPALVSHAAGRHGTPACRIRRCRPRRGADEGVGGDPWRVPGCGRGRGRRCSARSSDGRQGTGTIDGPCAATTSPRSGAR